MGAIFLLNNWMEQNRECSLEKGAVLSSLSDSTDLLGPTGA